MPRGVWTKKTLRSASLSSSPGQCILVRSSVADDLQVLSELIEVGKVRPQIDQRYPFAEIPEAIAYLEQGRARGKVAADGLRTPPAPAKAPPLRQLRYRRRGSETA